MRSQLTYRGARRLAAGLTLACTQLLGAQPDARPPQPQTASRSLVVDFGLLVTSIRPEAATTAAVHERDLGGLLGFSYRFARYAQIGFTMGFEGNDTSGVNDLLIMPLSLHAGLMTPTYRVGGSFGVSLDAALGWEYVSADRTNYGPGGCIGSGCYHDDLPFASGPFVEGGLRGYFGSGNAIKLGFGVHYRIFGSTADFANRVTATASLDWER
jgi:hypothetical protein